MTGPVEPPSGGGPIQSASDSTPAGGNSRPDRAFDVHGLDRTGQTESSVPLKRSDAILQRIREGLAKGLDRDQVLEDLVRHELAQVFGPTVSDAQVKAVTEAVLEDPRLGEVYARLLGMSSPKSDPTSSP